MGEEGEMAGMEVGGERRVGRGGEDLIRGIRKGIHRIITRI